MREQTNTSRDGSRKRKYVDIEFSKYDDKERANLTDLFSNQERDLIFEKHMVDDSYVAHVQFVESPEKDRSHTKNRSNVKNTSHSKIKKPQFSKNQGIKLFKTDAREDYENLPVNSQKPSTKENYNPNYNEPFRAREAQSSKEPFRAREVVLQSSKEPFRAREAPCRNKEPFVPATSVKSKVGNMEKWKEFFPSLQLTRTPRLRPILIGRLFMIEKIEQCYWSATQEWMAKSNQKIKFSHSIENLYAKLYPSKAVYNQNLMNLLYTAEKQSANYLDVIVFFKFICEKYSQNQFMFYLLFRHIFSEVTKIELYTHSKLKTDPNKLILTREVCDEMLQTGFKDNQNLINAVRKFSDPEIEQNNYIEYHVFMKMIIEVLRGNTTADPAEILNNLVFATETAKPQREKEEEFIKPNFEDFDSVQNPELSNYKKKKTPSVSPLKPKDKHHKPSVEFNVQSNEKSPTRHPTQNSAKQTNPNSAKKRSHAKDKFPKVQVSASKKAGANNNGEGGEFYIGTDEKAQSEIELFFRGQFTLLLSRFIESVQADQDPSTRDANVVMSEQKGILLSVVNRKCQNLLTALFSGNRANFIRLLNVKSSAGTIAVNLDDIYFKWGFYKTKKIKEVDEKACVEYLKKILKIEQLVSNITRYIMYATNDLASFV